MTTLETSADLRVAETDSIRVLVTSKERLFCDGLVARLRREADLNVIGVPYVGSDFPEVLTSLAPQVIVIDGEGSGMATVAEIVQSTRHQSRQSSIVALISTSELKSVTQLISLGINSCVLKSSPFAELVAAVHFVSRGSGWMPPSLLPRLFVELQQPVPGSNDKRLARLTAREREILSLMVEGKSHAEIARGLCLALTTTRTHTRNLMEKLGVHSSTAAVSVALMAGIRPSA